MQNYRNPPPLTAGARAILNSRGKPMPPPMAAPIPDAPMNPMDKRKAPAVRVRK